MFSSCSCLSRSIYFCSVWCERGISGELRGCRMLQLISQPSGACRNLSTLNNLRMFKLKRNETDRKKDDDKYMFTKPKIPPPAKRK